MMLQSFVSQPEGYVTEIDDEVAVILQQLLGETITVLDAPAESSVLTAITVDERRDEPDDPTLRILLPSMSSDPDEAQSLRAMTEDTLRTEKSARLEAIDEALREVAGGLSNQIIVPRKYVWEWLSGLNDLRLVLAQRLGVETEEQRANWDQIVYEILEHDADSDPGDEPRELTRDEIVALVFVLVSWWQDSLLQAVQSEGSQSTL